VLAVDKNRDFAQVLEERDPSGTIVNVAYIYGDDLISQERTGGALSFYAYDGQLSTRQLTDAAANITDSYTYDAFGVLLAQTGSTPNNYLYTGEQLDPNLGFYYLRARYLNQVVGRFLTLDPIGGVDEDPPSLHEYLYTAHSPTNYRDPSGEENIFITVGKLIVKAILLAFQQLVFRPALLIARVILLPILRVFHRVPRAPFEAFFRTGRGVTPWGRIPRVAGGGGGPRIPWHFHIHRHNWWKIWRWFE
jgi:RHS repeat-associated protein